MSPYSVSRVNSTRLGIWLFLGTVVMLFAAFASALLVRRMGSDWKTLPLPSLLWWNTAILVVASATLTLAQRQLPKAQTWMALSMVSGLLFLAGQILAWRQLTHQGVYLSTNPHSSFFYIISGLHAVHLLGGIFFLGSIQFRWPRSPDLNLLKAATTYWHFMTILWIVMFLILSHL